MAGDLWQGPCGRRVSPICSDPVFWFQSKLTPERGKTRGSAMIIAGTGFALPPLPARRSARPGRLVSARRRCFVLCVPSVQGLDRRVPRGWRRLWRGFPVVLVSADAPAVRRRWAQGVGWRPGPGSARAGDRLGLRVAGLNCLLPALLALGADQRLVAAWRSRRPGDLPDRTVIGRLVARLVDGLAGGHCRGGARQRRPEADENRKDRAYG